ncbi:hypothetical protein LCGC14_0826680 [marine sediment metagenome]|uniref:Peptidase M15C domain-containing protein n=1 Tax=marine sediment metagenome TaxID=412755 RepID=A0A0F9PLV6_9ZZZZ
MSDLTERDMLRLATCDVRLQLLVSKVAKLTPLMLIWGFRNEEEQTAIVKTGVRALPWPKSKHNHMVDGEPCSLAVDLGILPLEWKNLQHFRVLASYVWQESIRAKIPVKWLGHLDDYGHFELN